jgi:NitT/TauT family transport system substrate-binding protein
VIQAENPDLGDANIAFAMEQMKKYGIVDSGEAETKGIGAMSMDHIASFYEKMVAAGVIEADLDYASVVDLSFVNKGVGLEVKAKLLGN